MLPLFGGWHWWPAGIGFGVHISFVRSITMDKWSDDQLKKMKVAPLATHLNLNVWLSSSAWR